MNLVESAIAWGKSAVESGSLQGGPRFPDYERKLAACGDGSRLFSRDDQEPAVGPIADVKDWLNNYESFQKNSVVIVDAASVRLVGHESQFDCGLDDYAA